MIEFIIRHRGVAARDLIEWLVLHTSAFLFDDLGTEIQFGPLVWTNNATGVSATAIRSVTPRARVCLFDDADAVLFRLRWCEELEFVDG